MEYDRMNPDKQELLKRLKEYSNINYCKEAYSLSIVEAKLLTGESNINNSTIEKAVEFANKLDKQTMECPRGCLNPGLFFGYMAGYLNE